jgi:hypothetical protein
MMFCRRWIWGSRECLKVDAKTDFFVSKPRQGSHDLLDKTDTHTHTYNGHTKSSRHLRPLEKRPLCMTLE